MRQLLTILSMLLPAVTAAAESPKYLGPCAVVASSDGKTLYVASADARQLAFVALPAGEVTRRIDLPTEPTGLVLTPDGARLIVTCAGPKSTVLVLDPASGEQLASIPAGHTSTGPVVSPDGKHLYVCNRFDNDVSVIDLAAGKERRRVPAVREPIAAAITPDGRTVFVANHLPDTRTDVHFVDPVAPVLTLIDTATHEPASIELPRGSHSARTMCVSPDGKYVYVTHLVCNFELMPTQVDMGWIHVNVVSVIDVENRELVNTVGLDEMMIGAGNPWGVACSADGRTVCVTHAGSHELSIIDAPAMTRTLIQLFIPSLVGAIPEDSHAGLKPPRRIKLPGKGPRGLAVVGTTAYVAEYFSDSLAVVDLAAAADEEKRDEELVRSVALGPQPELSEQRRGELLFNDATLCYQHWQSCGSCHPDGRTDAINWDLMNDGASNPKNTKSMLLAHRTPPSMAEAVRPTAEAAVLAGVEHILFEFPEEQDAAAIDAYLKSLKPVPSPRLVDGGLSPAAVRGKAVFERVGCAKCHPAPLYTDRKMHDVGTKTPFEYAERLDTPTLVEVWRTAPYLHDGRFLRIKHLIAEGNHGRTRGRVDLLSPAEIDDLVEFVESL